MQEYKKYGKNCMLIGVVQAWVDHFVTSLSLHYPYLKVKKQLVFTFGALILSKLDR